MSDYKITASSVNKLDEYIKNILTEYTDEVHEICQEEAERSAKEARKDLRKIKDPGSEGQATRPWKGHYNSGWSIIKEKGLFAIKVSVANTKQGALTHLLEFGHITRNGTRKTFADTPAHPHIAEINDRCQKNYLERVIKRIKQ